MIIVDQDPAKPLQQREVAFNLEEMPKVEKFEIHPTYAESPSVLHYTSGTTGQPKGVKHVHYSLIAQYLTSKWVLDLRDDDIYWCTADPGWVTGTSYGIIGAFSNGVTQCVLDSGFSAESWYRFIEKHRITMWYSAPTAIRSLMKAGDEIIKKFDLSCLRHLASVGEPLNSEAVIWSEKVFGKPFLDTYWQTETGSIMITNFPGMKIKPGSMGKPSPGYDIEIVDENGNSCDVGNEGEIVIHTIKSKPVGMFNGYYRDDHLTKSVWSDGIYKTGDMAWCDEDGYFWFVGRADDVIKSSGYRIGPFEVESALMEHPAVLECAITAVPDADRGQIVKATIVPSKNYQPSEELAKELQEHVKKVTAPYKYPRIVEFVTELPKTISGKIRRVQIREENKNE